MALSRIGTTLLGAALAFFAMPAATAASIPVNPDPVANFGKPLYQAGEIPNLTVTGTPGDHFFLLFDRAPGSTRIQGVGMVQMEMGQNFSYHYMGTIPKSGIFEASCNPDCDSFMVGGPLLVQAVTFNTDPQRPILARISNLAVVDVVRGDDCYNCPRTPYTDKTFNAYPGGTAVYLHGIGNDFVFAPGASFAEYGDGTARLTGEIYRPAAPSERFLLDTHFSGFLGLADGPAFPPVGSPKEELLPTAYSDMGGPVNPATWHYYQSFSGLLIGTGDFFGGAISIDRVGPAFQVGNGANGKDLTYGGSGWMNVNVLAQPANTTWLATGGGDINIGIGDCPPDERLCVRAAVPDTYSPQLGVTPHAVVMFQLDGKFLFDGQGGIYTEYPDGSARMQGEIYSINDPAKRWIVDLFFNSRIDAGAPSNPPPGSPKIEMLPSAYIGNGGPIDPATWHYFEDTIGTFTGAGVYDGALLLVTRRGPAYQVGYGANGKNIQLGGALWTFFDVLTQPIQGPPLALKTEGDVNVILVPCKPMKPDFPEDNEQDGGPL